MADIRLIALAHTLEVAAHGAVHLRSEPAQARPSTVSSLSSRQLPGWGEVGGDWAEMDQMQEEELAAAERAQGTLASPWECIAQASTCGSFFPLDANSLQPYCDLQVLLPPVGLLLNCTI